MAPVHAPWRHAEYDLLASGWLSELCAETGVAVLGTRALQQLWIRWQQTSGPGPLKLSGQA
jgi:hypothetical protein